MDLERGFISNLNKGFSTKLMRSGLYRENDVSHLRRDGVNVRAVTWRFKGRVLPVLATHCRRLSHLEAPGHSDSRDPAYGRQMSEGQGNLWYRL